ncbi:MAG: mechanosensitive ion channel family protein [Oscillospiraceae bacterium]|nr:mechanosensitive ion channel family protein [Oscillospiraceae bacterium]
MKEKNYSPIRMLICLIVIIALFCSQKFSLLGADLSAQMAALISSTFPGGENSTMSLSHLLVIALMVAIVWLGLDLLRFVVSRLALKNGRSKTVAELVISISKYIAVIIAVIWGCTIIGIDVSAVVASLGVLGLILGFGAQSLIEDIVTGIFMIFEGQFNIGDIIILDDFRGTVVNIGVRATTIRDDGGNEKVVNNSDIRNFQNRSRVQSLAVCDIGISYGANLKETEAVILSALPDMLEANKDVWLTAPIYKGVEALADSSVVLRFIVYCTEENVFAARRRLNGEMKNLFDEKGIEIPFPQVDVHHIDKGF